MSMLVEDKYKFLNKVHSLRSNKINIVLLKHLMHKLKRHNFQDYRFLEVVY